MITRAIRHHLSKYIHNNKNDVFRSKSLCVVFVTKKASHRGVKFFESHDRSGRSLGTNQERYLEQNILELTLSGTYALNWWVDASQRNSNQRFITLDLT